MKWLLVVLIMPYLGPTEDSNIFIQNHQYESIDTCKNSGYAIAERFRQILAETGEEWRVLYRCEKMKADD